MKDYAPNHYERAFENWLIENHIKYVHADEHSRHTLSQGSPKSFDFLLYLRDGRTVIAEVKGRRFKGTTLAKLTGLECWVTTEDIDGLVAWQSAFEQKYPVIIVFAYKIEKVDVDFDGRPLFSYDNNRYLFLTVNIEDYIRFMKQRSPKWRTVTLGADSFRQCARPIGEILL